MRTSAPWQPIGEIIADFRTECADFNQLVQGLFDQLDQMQRELDHRMRDLEREREKVAERERQLSDQRQETNRFAHQFEHQEAKLSEALTELEALKALICEQRSHRPEPSADPDIRELQQERHALETELELVRGRAAELYDALVQQKRALDDYRQETSGELKQLRRIVEKQAELLAEGSTGGATSAAHRESGNTEEDDEPAVHEAPADPVVSSVMAQFAKLQKEVAERRKQRQK